MPVFTLACDDSGVGPYGGICCSKLDGSPTRCSCIYMGMLVMWCVVHNWVVALPGVNVSFDE